MRPIIASSPSQKVAAKATFRHSASSPSDSQIGSYHRAMVGADHRAARNQTTFAFHFSRGDLSCAQRKKRKIVLQVQHLLLRQHPHP